MHYTTENNWAAWSYDNGPLYSRSNSPAQQFQTIYNTQINSVGSLWDEAVLAAKSTIDHYPNQKLSLFFSGGVDSELMIRAFLHIKSNFDLYVVRYNNDINIYDVSYAIAIANSLNLDIKIIDMDLNKFYEMEAEKISEIAQCDRPRVFPQIKFADYVDGLPILAMGDLGWHRTDNDYTKKGTWLAEEHEFDYAFDRYNIETNRTAIYQWMKWSPGLFLAHMKTKWFSLLTNDTFEGKIGNTSTKFIGYKECIPDLLYRQKMVGLENCKNLTDEVEKMLYKKYNGLPFRRVCLMTKNELCYKIFGKSYGQVRNIFK